MVLLEKNGYYREIPAFNKAEVFDVTGAGDTVAALLTLGTAAGLNLEASMLLSNLAASLVVRKAGAATTSLTELSKALEQNDFNFFNKPVL